MLVAEKLGNIDSVIEFKVRVRVRVRVRWATSTP
jgi:hypothetical protein